MENLDDFAKSDLDKLERLAKNFEWFHSHYDMLKKEYDHQYVAIQDRQILANDAEFERLVKRLNIRNYDESIAIDFVKN
ncbi:MAG: DUF5678 domain-containing protein [Candidatus Nitrosocosmicus sp.]|nr:DUF5678 domain-containing protein [Candidatus Nitrosocosmicus sp.]MDN5868748.1 DUF5678 domain-containing protein [Candidatus Nitrosocosmicus sp.]